MEIRSNPLSKGKYYCLNIKPMFNYNEAIRYAINAFNIIYGLWTGCNPAQSMKDNYAEVLFLLQLQSKRTTRTTSENY